ncbi:hypothetical protein JIG36_10300 [Actinoplanes sp. LDG1-06]|uniref:Uncharacterized protein n=1 Tax=Paractinoplanes ovalisporus TaxID=2810368 RepID=A0ABS2A813_9ACTN|nr:hypothetical protein [Actinoplanes ovalisporus]
MLTEWKRRKAAERVKPGNGRPLKPFRWWQQLNRALFHLPLVDADGRQVVYSVDVRHWQQFTTEDGKGKAHLYADGRHIAESKLPAAFPVNDGTAEGGIIEVKESAFGLKRCHFIAADGSERQLTPDPASAEGRRARLDRERPGLSRGISVFSVLLLFGPLALLALQLAESITRIPPVAERFGTFTSPVDLPLWLNVTLGVVAAAASTERALRLRYSTILDGS